MSDDLIERLRYIVTNQGDPTCALSQAADALAAKDKAISEMRAELETERHALGHEIRIKSEAIAEYRRARKALEDIRDGYGPNHMSKYARDVAARALSQDEPADLGVGG